MDRKIIGYLPEYLREYYEIQEICSVEQAQAEKIDKAREKIWNNQFTESLDEDGCKRWEKMLGYVSKDTYTLEERRYKIFLRQNQSIPYSKRAVIEKLTTVLGKDGYRIEIDNNNYSITVRLMLLNKNMFSDCEEILKEMVPANMILSVIVMYNQHDMLSKYTHDQLGRYTHLEVREEVMK